MGASGSCWDCGPLVLGSLLVHEVPVSSCLFGLSLVLLAGLLLDFAGWGDPLEVARFGRPAAPLLAAQSRFTRWWFELATFLVSFSGFVLLVLAGAARFGLGESVSEPSSAMRAIFSGSEEPFMSGSGRANGLAICCGPAVNSAAPERSEEAARWGRR